MPGSRGGQQQLGGLVQRARGRAGTACLDLEGAGVLGEHDVARRLNRRHFRGVVAAVEAGAGGGAEAACRGGAWGSRALGDVRGQAAMGKGVSTRHGARQAC